MDFVFGDGGCCDFGANWGDSVSYGKVSVIIPVYNTESYLREAVESVINQSYQNWECLLIDDGSTDSSGNICDEYALLDERICVYHTENKGLSHARNTGINHASGQWYQFLDSDDYLSTDALETALRYSGHSDIVIYGLRQFPKKADFQSVTSVRRYDSFFDMAKEIEALFCRGTLMNACSKIYRASSFRKRFDETVIHAEDILFNLEYFVLCKGICIIPDLLYFYRKNQRATLSMRFWADHFEINKKILRLAEDNYYSIPEALTFFRHYFALECIKYFCMVANIRNISCAQKMVVMQTCLEDPVFYRNEIRTVRMKGGRQLLWKSVLSQRLPMVYGVFRFFGKELIHWKNK